MVADELDASDPRPAGLGFPAVLRWCDEHLAHVAPGGRDEIRAVAAEVVAPIGRVGVSYPEVIFKFEEHRVDGAGGLALAVAPAELRRVRPRALELDVLEPDVRVVRRLLDREVALHVVLRVVGTCGLEQALAAGAEDVRVRGGCEPGGGVGVNRAVHASRPCDDEEERARGGERHAARHRRDPRRRASSNDSFSVASCERLER